MKYRAYFQLKIELLSPLAIGASDSTDTDQDICLNSKNEPMIPASSIAGVYRSLVSDDEKKTYFGYIYVNEKPVLNSEERRELVPFESMLKFYDARLDSGFGIQPISRDGVALSDEKTAIKGAKFDFQSVKTGAVFIGYIEAGSREAGNVMKELINKQVSFGSKTTRGYGKVKISYRFREFNIEDSDDLESWLNFDMFHDFSKEYPWYEGTTEQEKMMTKLVLLLKQKGGLSIRQYKTDPKANENDQPPDYGPLSIDGIPVIPGTSWAGVFRHNAAKLLKEKHKNEIDAAFGFVDKKKAQKSKVAFGESRIDGFQSKVLVRNAIDRFTSGTKDGALYTEETIYGGSTALEITINHKTVSAAVISAICATIIDLDEGFVAVGGLTAVGRGLFSVTSIFVNESEISKVDYNCLRAVIPNES